MRRLADGVELWVHVQPRATHAAVGGLHGDALQVRVQAPPTEGRANAAVCRAVADALALRPAAVELVRGPRARRKRLRVLGDPDALWARLTALAEA